MYQENLIIVMQHAAHFSDTVWVPVRHTKSALTNRSFTLPQAIGVMVTVLQQSKDNRHASPPKEARDKSVLDVHENLHKH
jgi:hypothetical protein